MIVGLGIDLVDSNRVVQELARGAWSPRDGVFTSAEIAYCNRGKHPERRYATCFAAKEATLKALNVDVLDLAMFREVEVSLEGESKRSVLRDRLELAAKQLGVNSIHLSVAVSPKSAAALVILESERRETP